MLLLIGCAHAVRLCLAAPVALNANREATIQFPDDDYSYDDNIACCQNALLSAHPHEVACEPAVSNRTRQVFQTFNATTTQQVALQIACFPWGFFRPLAGKLEQKDTTLAFLHLKATQKVVLK